MKLLDKFLDTIGLVRKSFTTPSALIAGMTGWLSGGGISKDVLMDSGRNWVYTCMRAIAEEVGKIELRLISIKKDGTEEEIFEHELLDVIYKANNFMTKNELFELLSMHWDLAGNAYWFMEGVNKPGDLPTAFYPLNPKYLKIKKGKWPVLIEKYAYKEPDQQGAEYDPFKILHFRLPNPNNLAEGLGTVEAIAEWVDVENFATKWNRLWFWNGARPDLALTTENNLTADQQEILRTSFESVYKGVENAHKVAIMPKGTDLKDISKSHKDMDFTELDRVYRDKILAGFRVPRTALGITDDVNRANAEVTNYVFALRTIKPRLQRIVDYLNEFLVPRYGENIYLTFKDPVPENRELELEENKAALGGQPYKSVNEVRENDGLPAIENGDAVSTNFSLVPLGKPIEKAQPKKIQIKKRPGQRKKDEILSGVASAAAKMVTAEIKAVVEKKSFKNEDLKNDDLWGAAWKLFIGRVTPYEKALREEIKKYNEKQKEKVLAALSGLVKGVKAINPKDLLNVKDEIGAFIKLATPVLFELFGKEGEAALALIGADQAFDFTSQKVKEKLNAAINLLAESYNETTLDLLKTKLSEGLDAGEGLDQLKDRVSTIYEFSDEYRAARVAQTETFRTGNAATREAWKQSGVVKTLKWYTAEDEQVCEFCGPMHDKTVGVEEKWFDRGEEITGADGGKLNVDYVDIENPPLHANCRCYIRPEEISIE
ncbi:MAG: phage portal protein [Patescibacteria group bacterium]